MILTRQALSQSNENAKSILIPVEPVSLEDLKRLDEIVQKYPILQELVKSQQKTIDELKASLDTEKKINELNQKEIYLLNKQHELDQREVAIVNQANARLLEINDRAIKLAEVSKPPAFGNLQLIGIVGGVAALIGYILGSK